MLRLKFQASLKFRLAFCLLLLAGLCTGAVAQEVDFNNDVRPILADTCFKCHGPDEHERKADLRLDTKEGLLDTVVANQIDASELFERIISDDPDLLMPPPDSGRKLSGQQIETLKRWIEQGAKWENHWSIESPVKPPVPQLKDDVWGKSPIDQFVLKSLRANGLQPSEEAPRSTLIRRAAFDITGLPPSKELVEKYLNSQSSDWYPELLDELLESPRYGEHMARFWLDAARYGDTHGLHLDNYREMWPYRDWVINAFNRNMSYRDFTIEQLAGDLLENPTDEQKIASGFNRAHITTSEGGAIVEEVYVRNVVDRVSTTGTIFLGMTVGCAQCHDHKFDPISQKEFYQLFAFFNNMTDPAMDRNAKDPAPVMKVHDATSRQKLADFENQIKRKQKELDDAYQAIIYSDLLEDTELATADSPQEFTWVDDEVLPVGARKQQAWRFVDAKSAPVNSGSVSRLQEGSGMVQHFFEGAAAPLKAQKGDRFFAYVYLDPANPPSEIMLQFNDGSWDHRAYWGDDKIDWGKNKSPSRFHLGPLPKTGEWVRLEVKAESVGFSKLTMINGIAFTQFDGKAYWDNAGIVSKTNQQTEFVSYSKWLTMARATKGAGLPANVKGWVNKPIDKRTEAEKNSLLKHFLTTIHPSGKKRFGELAASLSQIRRERDGFNNSIPTTLISKESDKIKDAFVLIRGDYDKKGDKVTRQTPAFLPPFSEEFPRNRLGFAQWLTTDNHPLTARVAVNRFWQQLFGNGLVKTSEDFGAQGETPSHPELLDWLAVDFVENGWDVKRLIKQMMLSSVYRQSSKATAEGLQVDPENRLLSHGPRFRLDAEMLRDQALDVSELLVNQIGGPGVKPPQPDGLWFAVGYSGSNTVRFKKDSGQDKVHRRSLYTFWKRTAPPPQMNTFDAPSREECRVRRERTNTPLQALLLMNDPQYVEAARYFGQSVMDRHLGDDQAAVTAMFEKALVRSPSQQELAFLVENLKANRNEFKSNIDSAKRLIAIGEVKADEKYDPVELASWTMVANLIMNMDEFVSKN